MTAPDYTWVDRAACHGIPDPGIFFPDINGKGTIHKRLGPVADQYCRHCPVRSECRTEAQRIRDHEPGGVWGLWNGVWYRRVGSDVDLLPDLPLDDQETA
jgi:hypothetical protein